MEYDTHHYDKETDTISGGGPDSKMTLKQAIVIIAVAIAVVFGLIWFFECTLNALR